MQSTSTWSPMLAGPEDEFSNFLDFSDLQLNFPPYDGTQPNGQEIQDGPPSALDMQTTNSNGSVLGFQPDDMHNFTDASSLGGFNGPSNVFSNLELASQNYEQQHQQQLPMQQPPSYGEPYIGRHVIPHTPSSIEMHGGRAQYQQAPSHNHPRAVYDHYRQQANGQVGRRHDSSAKYSPHRQTNFTPLVSPAVTPHDAQFRYQDYAIPSEYFSPLTSPALEAQNAQNNGSQRSVYSAVRGSDTSDTTSPIDLNIDPSLQPVVQNGARKPRRRTSNAAQRNPSRTVRQSPSMKPQAKKKHSSSTTIPPSRVSDIIEDAENAKRSNGTSQYGKSRRPVALSRESSEAESISPEPLSEILMPPPATPKSASASKSPQVIAKPGSQSAPMPALDNKPVTPSSLMMIRKGAAKVAGSALKEQTSQLESELEQTMEAMIVPDSSKPSAKRPALTPLRTSDANDDETTPTMSARKTPKIAPTSAPATATGSAFSSPKLNPVASPNGVTQNKRGDTRSGGRGGKRRTNSSSVQVSPALRPRISPSIKPLLPEGAVVSAETSALLLASKSNYQNLLEGTHLPGVSYPETLSTNLTTKRTSHKLAEQGRRNRINTALQELASLLPPTLTGATSKDSGAPCGKVSSPGASVMMTGTPAQQSNSKASTVELAIDHIKNLVRELDDVRTRLEGVEHKLADREKSCKDGVQGPELVAVNGKEGNDDG
ncbi:MAG: hypothetical protein Q9219_000793 [cf. Caloplaca sp. 3 TL-2023]